MAYDYIGKEQILAAGDTNTLDALVEAIAKEHKVILSCWLSYAENAEALSELVTLLRHADYRWLQLEDEARPIDAQVEQS